MKGFSFVPEAVDVAAEASLTHLSHAALNERSGTARTVKENEAHIKLQH